MYDDDDDDDDPGSDDLNLKKSFLRLRIGVEAEGAACARALPFLPRRAVRYYHNNSPDILYATYVYR